MGLYLYAQKVQRNSLTDMLDFASGPCWIHSVYTIGMHVIKSM